MVENLNLLSHTSYKESYEHKKELGREKFGAKGNDKTLEQFVLSPKIRINKNGFQHGFSI